MPRCLKCCSRILLKLHFDMVRVISPIPSSAWRLHFSEEKLLKGGISHTKVWSCSSLNSGSRKLCMGADNSSVKGYKYYCWWEQGPLRSTAKLGSMLGFWFPTSTFLILPSSSYPQSLTERHTNLTWSLDVRAAIQQCFVSVSLCPKWYLPSTMLSISFHVLH